MNHIQRGFASDNNAGIDPEIFEAIRSANHGHVIAYGDDTYTKKATEALKDTFGGNTKPYFVMTGTGANVLGLSSVLKPYNAVICAETAHINVDECGALERFAGSKLISIDTPDGKLTPELVRGRLKGFGFEHHVQPKVISISQPTEMGTVYTISEVAALSALAKEYDLYLHMDGARLANAAVSLGKDFKEFTSGAGVDVLSFGGTKNGMLFGEAVLFFRKNTGEDFKYIRKQGLHLSSKMRFISVQFDAYLRKGIWKKNAEHANAMAKLLYDKISVMQDIKITQALQSNAVFAEVPRSLIKPLMQKYFFYIWDDERNEVRWMTSFDTQKDDIMGFTDTIKSMIENSGD
jgi:threonine aldolase